MKVYRSVQPGVDDDGNSKPGPIGPLYLAEEWTPPRFGKSSDAAASGPVYVAVEQQITEDGDVQVLAPGWKLGLVQGKYGDYIVLEVVRALTRRGIKYFVHLQCSCGSETYKQATTWSKLQARRCKACAIAKRNALRVGVNPTSGEYLTRLPRRPARS